MAKCPNCDRKTTRTEDWACQWCGYPLLHGSYKRLPKTYQQLKEERQSGQEPKLEPEPEPEPEPAPEPEPEPEPAPAAIEITAEELVSAFETDGVAADARFNNQLLKVTGVVNRMEVRNVHDMCYITLTNAGKNLLQTVRCTFGGQHGPELSRLTGGQTVTVQGRCSGSVIDISIRDCVLVH